MTTAEKIQANRVRRMAQRQGLRLVKSRRRDPRALDYGGCMLVDAATTYVVYGFGYNNFGASLDDAERFLLADRESTSEGIAQ